MNVISAKTEPMFSAIAARYDLCNHLFSFGLDWYWRRKAVAMACSEPVEAALDLCCGTGDVAFTLAKTGKVKSITGGDVSQPMLNLAARKAQTMRSKWPAGVSFQWLCVPAEQTKQADQSFDLITCAFGLRNVDNLSLTLSEMHRMLKPGGKACILEFFLPNQKWLRKIYMIYLGTIMPLLGKRLTGSSGPWDYLAQSIENWTDKINLKEQLLNAGFREVRIYPLTFQAVQVYIAHN